MKEKIITAAAAYQAARAAARDRIAAACVAAIGDGSDQDAAMTAAAIAAIEQAVTPLAAAAAYQAAAACLDSRRPGGIGGPSVLPSRHDGADWVWARVDTRGTGNGGRWVATRPRSANALGLRRALLGALARLMPGFDIAFLAGHSLFWEHEILAWLGGLSAAEAAWLGAQPEVTSRHAARIERQGFALPAVSVPRTVAAIRLAASAARRAASRP